MSEGLARSLEELLEEGAIWSEGAPPRARRAAACGHVPFGLEPIDAALATGGLLCGATHEFCMEGAFNVPRALLSALALRAFLQHEGRRYCVWIGEDCRPNPLFLRSMLPKECVDAFFSHAFFVAPRGEKKLLWTLEAALRSPAVASVIVALPKLSFALSRRLSLAAAHSGALGLFIVAQGTRASAAHTRWLIRPAPSASPHPRFEISLLKQKAGMPPQASWQVEFIEDGEKVSFALPSDVVSEPLHAAEAHEIRKRA